ncbi:hypothetical protein Dimus_017681 [Dionaea muscipula]
MGPMPPTGFQRRPWRRGSSLRQQASLRRGRGVGQGVLDGFELAGGKSMAGEGGDEVAVLDMVFEGFDGSELLVVLGLWEGLVRGPAREVAELMVDSRGD